MEYEFVKNFLKKREKVSAAFGYGSAFFKQSGYNEDTKVVYNLIFVVSDIKEWHKNNYKLKPSDYTLSSKIYLNYFPKILIKGKTKMSYNVEIQEDGKTFKYGVIEMKDLYKALEDWKSFYISGRIQKPIYTLKSYENIDDLIKMNRKHALLVSLIILNKELITIDELLEQICKLSYYGDVEQLFIGNPNKVKNIVKDSLEFLKEIYLNCEYFKIKDNKLIVDLRKVKNDYYLLPDLIRNKINLLSNKTVNKNMIVNTLKCKNFVESIEQPLKGIFSNGPKKGFQYLLKKKNKNRLK